MVPQQECANVNVKIQNDDDDEYQDDERIKKENA